MSDSKTSRRVLIVTPSFPPMNAPDMQRVRMSLPHYRENGWEPVILAVDPAGHGGVTEAALLATVPQYVVVHRCGAFPLKWSRLLGIGNLGLRSWLQLLLAGRRIIRRDAIDLVFISNTQFVTFTLGRLWQKLLGVPYVIDLQDPWRTDYYKGVRKKERPGGWKYAFAQFQAGFLESWSLQRASGLMSVSQKYIEDLQQRYPWISRVPSETIGFGASEADLSAAASLERPKREECNDRIRIVYTGVAGPVMQSALTVLFDGLKAFRAAHPSALRLNLNFLGTSYAPADSARTSVEPLALEFDCADLVSETPARLGHLESLREQTSADALLLLGTNDAAYAPSKLHPYFLSGRPMLAIVRTGSQLERQLRDLSCAVIVTFDSSGPNERTRKEIGMFFGSALSGFPKESLPTRNEALFRQQFLAGALTQRQCALFDRALADHISTANHA